MWSKHVLKKVRFFSTVKNILQSVLYGQKTKLPKNLWVMIFIILSLDGLKGSRWRRMLDNTTVGGSWAGCQHHQGIKCKGCRGCGAKSHTLKRWLNLKNNNGSLQNAASVLWYWLIFVLFVSRHWAEFAVAHCLWMQVERTNGEKANNS